VQPSQAHGQHLDELIRASFSGTVGPVVNNFAGISFNVAAQHVVPEPYSLTLFGLGSLGLLGYGWRRRKRATT